MDISIIVPLFNEEESLPELEAWIRRVVENQGWSYEIIMVDDGSKDSTWKILQEEMAKIPELKPIRSPGPHGFGRAITRGLNAMTGDAVVIMMADESDDPRDVVRYWQKLQEGYDCVFGSRFVGAGEGLHFG